MFLIADWISRRISHPEYAIFSGWVLSQAAIGVAVAVTGGHDSPILVVAAMPIVSLSARFPVRVVAAGVVITLAIMAAATVGVDPDAVGDDPTLVVLCATVVLSVGVLSTALLRSDLEHRDQAVVDPLTGMLNRSALDGRIAELEQQSRVVDQPIAVIVADVDRFKSINDKQGHAAGDQVLAEVSSLIRNELRAFDLAYRIGGDEFLMLVPGAGLDDAKRLADTLRKAIDAEPLGDGLRVTASFGVSASKPGEPFEYSAVFDDADSALLKAKTERPPQQGQVAGVKGLGH